MHTLHLSPLQEVARRKQEALDRKKANQAKSAVVTAVSTATAKKLMKHKKQRKLLKTADTN
jgi:rRNA-processing protein CGR1